MDKTVPVKGSDGQDKLYPVRDVLRSKHPCGKPVQENSLLHGPIDSIDPVIFDAIDGTSIHAAALRISGAAGPSGLDANGWKRLCVSFHVASKDLCDSMAAVARRLCTCFVDPKGIEAFVTCRLIPLDKCPGVRPIGIGEVPRRLIAKSILKVLKQDIIEASGSLQLCAGQEAGCEAASHAMRSNFSNEECEAVLLVDANNAFNTLNCQATLRNIRVLCPTFSTILINTYRSHIKLLVFGDEHAPTL